jgi:hypothetical protein
MRGYAQDCRSGSSHGIRNPHAQRTSGGRSPDKPTIVDPRIEDSTEIGRDKQTDETGKPTTVSVGTAGRVTRETVPKTGETNFPSDVIRNFV